MTGYSVTKNNARVSVLFLSLSFGIVVLCFLAVFLFGFIPHNNNWLKEKIGDFFVENSFITCTIGNVSLTPFRGITIHDLELQKNLDSDDRLVLFFPTIEMTYFVLPIITQWKRLGGILSKRADQMFLQTSNSLKQDFWHHEPEQQHFIRWINEEVSRRDTVISTYVKSIHVEKGHIHIDRGDESVLILKEIKGGIFVSNASTKKLIMDMTIDSVTLYGVQFDHIYAHSAIHDQVASVTLQSTPFFQGSFTSNFEFDIMQACLKRGDIQVRDLVLHEVFSLFFIEKGSIGGKASLHFTFDSTGHVFTPLTGKGRIQALTVRVKDLPILEQIAEVTMLPVLTDLTFDTIQGDFSYGEKTIQSENLQGLGDPLSIDLSGSFKLERGLHSLQLKGKFEPYYKDSLSEVGWNSLYPEKDGRRSFTCTIDGTLESTKIGIEKKQVERAINTILKSFTEELKSLFKP